MAQSDQQGGQPHRQIQNLFITQTQDASMFSMPGVASSPPVIPANTPCIDGVTGNPKQPTLPNASLSVNVENLSVQNMYGQFGSHNNMNVNHNYYSHDRDSELSSDSDEQEEREPFDPRLEKLMECTRLITDKDLQILSKHLGGHWKYFVRNLDVDEADIERECYKHGSGGTPEVVYQLLLMWKRDSVDPTVSTIACALHECELKRVITNFITDLPD